MKIFLTSAENESQNTLAQGFTEKRVKQEYSN